MTDAWRSIKLTEFEHVVTGPSQSLLRVGGHAPQEGAAGPRPILVMQTAAGEARFHPLPAAADRAGMLEVAYSVPTAVIADCSRCWLELADDGRIDLPAPEQGAARHRDGDPEQWNDDELLDAVAPDPSGSAKQPAEQAELTERIAELEQARQDAERAATATADEAEARVTSAEHAVQSAHDRVAVLERELAAQTSERDALREDVRNLQAGRRSDERELDQSRDQLRLMTFERDELSRQAAAFDAIAVKARERASAAAEASASVTSKLEELQVWRGELERRLADTTTQLSALRAARESDQSELMRLRAALTEYERGAAGRGGGANGADATDEGEIIAAQAEEIQHLAAELAELRSRAARES